LPNWGSSRLKPFQERPSITDELRSIPVPILSYQGKRPKIHPKARVAPNATIVGDVEIGLGTSVWPGAVLRADWEKISIGRFTSVQDNVVMHGDPGFPTRIGDRVTVGHSAIVHGCTVEDDCIIGAGSTVFNGSVVGSHTIVGLGAVIPEGQTIPRRSIVVGVPGKVIKEITAEQEALIAASVEHYRALARNHMPLFGRRRRAR